MSHKDKNTLKPKKCDPKKRKRRRKKEKKKKNGDIIGFFCYRYKCKRIICHTSTNYKSIGECILLKNCILYKLLAARYLGSSKNFTNLLGNRFKIKS